jgi:hypothetical protein
VTRSDKSKNLWIYPFGARNLMKNITAAPLSAAREDVNNSKRLEDVIAPSSYD